MRPSLVWSSEITLEKYEKLIVKASLDNAYIISQNKKN